MADYYPLLSRAVTGLATNEAGARLAIYGRARDALERYLDTVSPSLSDTERQDERSLLEEVIRRIEAENTTQLDALTTQPVPEPVLDAGAPDAITPVDASASLDAKAQPPLPAIEAPPVLVPHALVAPVVSKETQATTLDAPVEAGMVNSEADAELTQQVQLPPEGTPVSAFEALSVEQLPADNQLDADTQQALSQDDFVSPSKPEPQDIIVSELNTEMAVPIIEPIRPQSMPRIIMPENGAASRSSRKIGLLAFGGFAVMCAMATIALVTREDTRKYKPTAPVADRQEVIPDLSKREGRLVGTEPSAEASPTQRPEQNIPPAGAKGQSSGAAQSNGTAANTTPSQAALPIASRAFMVLEVSGNAPNQYEGQANWSFTAEKGSKSPEKAIRATVEFTAAGLNVDFSLSRNTDPALNASHTILIAFEPKADLPNVREMSAIEWRERENQTGVTFAGILVPVQDNFFMIGLDKTDFAQNRNLDLLRNQKWMVFEILLANNRRGAMLIEKGSSGERAILDALAAWK